MKTDHERWREADRIFSAALDLPLENRSQFLDAECADPETRVLVERLLSHTESHSDTLPGSVTSAQGRKNLEMIAEQDDENESWVGRTIDRFRILEEIGRGGMAVVYLAERADGEFDQRVALKLIKRGIDTDEVLRRFSRERQIMAGASHPNIARLLDGGSTDDGRPYFVMEHVAGTRIDRYCDDRRLRVKDRLSLFQQVASAVAYAHRNLIVHRDIKPSNILVDDEGVVKLLDFGIAGFIEGDGNATRRTVTSRGFMTPTWASPEQIRGKPITTASDVYQLGLLLYRLLAGTPPYSAGLADPEKLSRAICDESPTRPSIAVSRSTTVDGETTDLEQIGRSRGTSPAALRGELEGDLDNIVLMALRKEPDRRYASVSDLNEDINRYLGDLPVNARSDSFSYRSGKFLRRNRVALGVGTVLALLLVSFSVTTLVQSREIARGQAQAEEIVSLLVKMFETNNPTVRPGGDAQTVGELLEASEAQVLSQLADQPEVAARMKHVLGKMYHARSNFDRAKVLFTDALEQRRELSGDEGPIVAEVFHDLAVTERQLQGAKAIPLLRESLERQTRAYGEKHPRVAQAMQDLAHVLPESDEKLELMTQALDLRREVLPPVHSDIAASLNQLGAYHFTRQNMKQSEQFLAESLEILKQIHGEDHPHVSTVTRNLAQVYLLLQDVDRAETMMRDNLRREMAVSGENSLAVATSLNNLATALAMKRDWDNALAELERAIQIYRGIHGDHHTRVANAIRNQGMVEKFRNRPREAIRYLDRALEAQQGFNGTETVAAYRLRSQRADLWTSIGRETAARRELTEVVALLEAATPNGSRALAEAQIALARTLLVAGRPGDAKRYYEHGLEFRRNGIGEDHPLTWEAHGGVGRSLLALGRPAEAEPLLRDALEKYRPFAYANPNVIDEMDADLRSVSEQSR